VRVSRGLSLIKGNIGALRLALSCGTDKDNPALSFATKFDAVVPVFILESEQQVTGAARGSAEILIHVESIKMDF
jgi:hypothetical protein